MQAFVELQFYPDSLVKRCTNGGGFVNDGGPHSDGGTDAPMIPDATPDAPRDGGTDAAPDDLVLAASFRLQPADEATIKLRLDEIRRWRQAHQPLGLPSAGSVFRNPASGPSAGALIDELGLKGRRIGGAVVSEKHANFIVNDQKGSAADVRALAEDVRAEVLARTGTSLAFEIVFLGDWSGTASASVSEGRQTSETAR